MGLFLLRMDFSFYAESAFKSPLKQAPIFYLCMEVRMKIGVIGFGKTGKAVSSTILRNSNLRLEWVVRRSELLDHRSIPEFLGEDSDEPGLILSSRKNQSRASARQYAR